MDCDSAGVFLIAPFTGRFNLPKVVQNAALSGSKTILSLQYFLSFLSLTKVHFDVIMTMVADTLYSMLAGKLCGFEHCDASKVCSQFIRAKGRVNLSAERLLVTFPRKARTPILRNVPWHRLPKKISWLGDVDLELKFQ